MDAMIFAAGLGTRLRPITQTIPKALVEVAGTTMLERVARRLVEAGATRLVINIHHHPEQIRQLVEDCQGFGVETLISDESEELLDTGGGLLNASDLFHRDAPFLIHNADILSDFDLRDFYQAHVAGDALATLAVMERETSRYLLFDEAGWLCGYGNSATGFESIAREPQGTTARLGFCGIHAVSPRIFDLITERGVFSIIALYMRLCGEGFQVAPYRIDGATWIDIGKPEQLERARSLFA